MLNIRDNEDSFPRDEETVPAPPEVAAVEPVPSEIELPASQELSSSQVLCLQPLSFGEQLRDIRAEAGMTVADVAHKVRSSQAFILNLESGDFQKIHQHDHYCKSFIERICLVYQVEPDELLEKFDQESRLAGRFPAFSADALQPGLSARSVFAEEDLHEDKSVNPALHVPAILITVLVALLFLLLISAWVVQKNRTRRNVEVLRAIENQLPDLITAKQIPLEVLPIPNN